MLASSAKNNPNPRDSYLSNIVPLSLATNAVIGCSGLGICGAISYRKNYILVALVAYCVTFCMDAYNANFLGMIANGFLVYPHAFLYKEIQNGTMTPQNYENEKRPCCCV